SGAAAVAGGAGAGAGGAGVAVGSVGASVLLKPAAGLLAVLAIGSAAVDRGAIFEADRHDPATADPGRSAPALVEHAGRSMPGESRAIAWRAGERSTAAPTRDRIDSFSISASTPPVTSTPATDEPGTSAVGPELRAGADPRSDDADAAPTVTKSPALEGATHEEAVVPGATPVVAPDGGSKSVATEGSDVPPGQAEKGAALPGQEEEEAESTSIPAPSEEESTQVAPTADAPEVPPGQAKKESVPPGQAKKQAETTSEPTTGEASAPASTPVEASAPASTPVEAPAHVPPGQAKKEEAATE
ncbi:MAG: hypothetical protein ACRDPE_01955, partial [Solirubrobacterales bacterium]